MRHLEQGAERDARLRAADAKLCDQAAIIWYIPSGVQSETQSGTFRQDTRENHSMSAAERSYVPTHQTP